MEEEKYRTEQMKTMIIESDFDDEESIVEQIEEFEDKIDYLDLDKKSKKNDRLFIKFNHSIVCFIKSRHICLARLLFNNK